EFGIQLTEVRPMATLESIHRFAGRDAHELVLVYEATTADPQVWSQPRLRSRRGDVTAIWAPGDMFRRHEAQLLPDAPLPLLGSAAPIAGTERQRDSAPSRIAVPIAPTTIATMPSVRAGRAALPAPSTSPRSQRRPACAEK